MDQNSHPNPFIHSLLSTFQHQDAEGVENTGPANGHEATVPNSTPGVNTRPSADARMDGDEPDDMPSLQDVSDSGSESGSDRDSNEVEMQPAEDNQGHNPTDSQIIRSAYISQSSSNRRARVHDDDDDERDRRHPSQRASNASSNAASSSSAAPTSPPVTLPPNHPHTHSSAPSSSVPSTTPQPPPITRPPSNNNIQRHVFRTTINLGNGGNANNPFRLFQHFLPNNNPDPLNNTANNNPVATHPIAQSHADNSGSQAYQAQPPAPTPPTQRQDGHNVRDHAHPLFGRMMSFELGNGGFLIPFPGGTSPPTPQASENGPDNQNANTPHQHDHIPPNLTDFLSRFGAQLANGTLAGLGFGFENQQEDPERARKLVNGLEVVPEGLVRRLERVGGSGGGMGEEPTKGGDSGCAICWDRLLDTDGVGFGSREQSKDTSGSSSLECLIPWFSRPRQTTCPTCRFNIDPDNLTYVSSQQRQSGRREARTAAAEGAQGVNPPGALHEGAVLADEAPPRDPAHTPDNTTTPNNNPSAAARNHLLNVLGNVYDETTVRPSRAEQQQRQGDAPTPGEPHLPAITVTSIPITIPVPIAFPVGTANGRQTMSGETVPNVSAGPSRPVILENIPRPVDQQPRPESGPDMAGEYARLFARLGRPSYVPVPLDAISPQSFRNLGVSQNAQPDVSFSTSNSTTPPNDTPSGLQGREFPFDIGILDGLGPGTPFGRRTATNVTPGASADPQHPPQPTNTNTFHLPGLDFGIPGMRADVVVTMDMIFDPQGPVGPEHRGDGAPAGEPHQDEVAVEEDIMMMIPEDDEDGGSAGDEVPGFGEEMLRMFGGVPRNAGNNANPFNSEQQPQEDEVPPTANAQQRQQPGFSNLGNGIHFAAGSGRSMGEAFAQLLARMNANTPNAQNNGGDHTPAQPHIDDPAQQQAQPGERAAAGGQPQPTDAAPQPFMAGGLFEGLFGGGFPGFGPRPRRREGPKPVWSLPPAPGLSLRQRIERREREVGLRCYDVSCGLGPSDEDPLSDQVSEAVSSMKQLVIREKSGGSADICEHRFHSACLVSAERVALRDADAVVEDGRVNVSCPVCRIAGCVTKEEWDAGVIALQS